MNGTTGASAGHGDGPWWRRRPAPILGAAITVAVVALAVILLADGDGGGRPDPAAAASTGSATTPSATSAEEPEATASAPAEASPAQSPAPSGGGLPSALPAVPLDRPIEQAGVTGSVVSVEAVDGRATGPGDVAGPALMVTVRLVNGTGEALSLDGVSVNLFSGADRAPSSPLGDPRRSPFTGTLAAGRTAQGVYVFSVPVSDRERIDVEVGYLPGQPLAVFSGAVR